MKFKIECTRLEKAEKRNGAGAMSMVAQDKDVKVRYYVAAAFNAHMENVDCYISLPSELLDDNLKIGDEFEVEIRRVK